MYKGNNKFITIGNIIIIIIMVTLAVRLSSIKTSFLL